jgi:hypothetical protein
MDDALARQMRRQRPAGGLALGRRVLAEITPERRAELERDLELDLATVAETAAKLASAQLEEAR